MEMPQRYAENKESFSCSRCETLRCLCETLFTCTVTLEKGKQDVLMKSKLALFSTVVAIVLAACLILLTMPPTATALPPRPTPTAVPTPAAPKPTGGIIELQVTGVQDADLWTLIQWQDGDGRWHDVDGWQGTLDDGHSKTWWVGAKELDTGPFRWVVQQDGAISGVSTPFKLPASPLESVIVIVALD